MADAEFKKKLRELHAQIAELMTTVQQQRPDGPQPTVRELWNLYVAAPEFSALAPVTRATKLSKSKPILGFFGTFPWDALTMKHVEQYRAANQERQGRQIMPGTRNHELGVLTSLLSWAADNNVHRGDRRPLIDHNPLAGLSSEPDPDLEERNDFHLSPEQLKQFLHGAHPAFKLMAELAYETGLRLSECRLLLKSEVNRRDGVLVLRRERTKSRRSRAIPLSDRAVQIINEAPSYSSSEHVFVSSKGTPWSSAAIHKWRHEQMEKTGVAGPCGQRIKFHALRKSFASVKSADPEMPRRALMDIMGHKDEATHRRYVTTESYQMAQLRTLMNRTSLSAFEASKRRS